jgi:hypothetical protein
VSLYLQTTVGAARYLLDAAQIVEIRAEGLETGGLGDTVPIVDLRDLFEANKTPSSACVLLKQEAGDIAALIVDQVEGLIELDDDEFSPLPPIGPLGDWFDAVSTRLAGEQLMLRLCGARTRRSLPSRPGNE